LENRNCLYVWYVVSPRTLNHLGFVGVGVLVYLPAATCDAWCNVGEPDQVSFVNSICTTRGGTHVNYIANMLAKEIHAAVSKKNKHVSLTTNIVKQYMFVFVNCLIENPAFDSQTKETLTTTVAKFGSKCEVPQTYIKKGTVARLCCTAAWHAN
jgi:hypothetical protein